MISDDGAIKASSQWESKGRSEAASVYKCIYVYVARTIRVVVNPVSGCGITPLAPLDGRGDG